MKHNHMTSLVPVLKLLEECAINLALCCLLVTINNAENCNSTLIG